MAEEDEMIVDTTLDGLTGRLSGELVLPGSTAYDEARKVFNGMIDKRPAVIARCATTDDVVAAVNFGRQNDLEISVRGGGHSVADAMRPFSTGGAYLNFTTDGDRAEDGYGNAKYARLVALKEKYDPTNLFRGNQNIESRSTGQPALA
jgi:FAD/FMN-containing dehydrogenase